MGALPVMVHTTGNQQSAQKLMVPTLEERPEEVTRPKASLKTRLKVCRGENFSRLPVSSWAWSWWKFVSRWRRGATRGWHLAVWGRYLATTTCFSLTPGHRTCGARSRRFQASVFGASLNYDTFLLRKWAWFALCIKTVSCDVIAGSTWIVAQRWSAEWHE